MSTFLSRPVFDFSINWRDNPVQVFEYDLRKLEIGFSPPRYAPLQEHPTHVYQFLLSLETEQKIDDFETFADQLKGRLTGFWFPTPNAAVTIEAGVDSTNFDITDQGLRDTWTDHPGQYLWFRKSGETSKGAKITTVAQQGSLERVTVDTSVSVDETWEAFFLRYVRFASDDEDYTVEAESYQTRTIRVVELPQEYASIESGRQPVYLYRFYLGSFGKAADAQDWYFTSLGEDVSSDYGGTITSTSHTSKPINHGELNDTLRTESESLQVTAYLETGTPFEKFLPMFLPRPLWLEVRSASYGTPDTTTLEFVGQVTRTQIRGRQIHMDCASMLDALGKRIPRMMIQSFCGYALYEPNTCRVTKSSFKKDVTIDSIDGMVVVVSDASLAGLAADWFAYGYLETGSGRTEEIRSILASSGESSNAITLTLNQTLVDASVGNSASIYPGCNLSVDHCKNKFSNFVNYGGHPWVSGKNLSLQAIEVENETGNKK